MAGGMFVVALFLGPAAWAVGSHFFMFEGDHWRTHHWLFGKDYAAVRFGLSDKVMRVRQSVQGAPVCYEYDQTFHLTPEPCRAVPGYYIAHRSDGTTTIWHPLTRGIAPSLTGEPALANIDAG